MSGVGLEAVVVVSAVEQRAREIYYPPTTLHLSLRVRERGGGELEMVEMQVTHH